MRTSRTLKTRVGLRIVALFAVIASITLLPANIVHADTQKSCTIKSKSWVEYRFANGFWGKYYRTEVSITCYDVPHDHPSPSTPEYQTVNS